MSDEIVRNGLPTVDPFFGDLLVDLKADGAASRKRLG